MSSEGRADSFPWIVSAFVASAWRRFAGVEESIGSEGEDMSTDVRVKMGQSSEFVSVGERGRRSCDSGVKVERMLSCLE